ncbi:MAG: aldehyde dehydrogenase EutE [Acidobacteria bacterium]|nr:aldehyde dehydrogenase EutE [Acidobacteriota bacterium]
MSTAHEQLIAEIAREVLKAIEARVGPLPVNGRSVPGDSGVFATVDGAVKAAQEAQAKVAALSLDDRARLCGIVRRLCHDNSAEWGRIELEETKLGRLDHKITKLKNIRLTVGAEAMGSEAKTDASGLCLIEHAPWGVIGMVLPATHSVPTMATNAINILAAGNTAVFSPHPAGARVAQLALKAFNREIEREFGIANALTTIGEATIKSAEEIFMHPGVALLCVTGGPAVVKAAAKSGKRVIAAGPGNPPVVVDETADLDAAARDIIAGASFDNNLLCIGEKEVFVVAGVADAFIAAMRRAGAVQLDAAAIDRLTKAAFRFDDPATGCGAHVKKEFVGKDVAVLAQAAGIQAPAGTDLLFGETHAGHPFVEEEQMMPFLPVVRVPDVDAAIAASVRAEHGYRHTAIIHTRNVDTATRMARAMNTTLFVHNGPCFASLSAPSYLSHSIATPTGEGVTTPLTFTRERRYVIAGGALRVL